MSALLKCPALAWHMHGIGQAAHARLCFSLNFLVQNVVIAVKLFCIAGSIHKELNSYRPGAASWPFAWLGSH